VAGNWKIVPEHIRIIIQCFGLKKCSNRITQMDRLSFF
jgi:hypothetical protein